MLDKLCSNISVSDIGHEFNINEWMLFMKMVSLNRKTHNTRLCIHKLTKML